MSSALFPRRARALAEEALRDSRVVLLDGARQVGKTTLAKEVVRSAGGRFLTLDDPQTLRAALDDPRGFVEGSGLLVIDEFQRAGDPLLRAIKLEVDRDPAPGRFLLTGSTRFLTVPALSESLAGRVEIVHLWPLSQGETLRRRERFLDRLFDAPAALRRLRPDPLSRSDYFHLVCRGGFPQAVLRRPSGLPRLFRSYLETLLARDVREISRVREVRDLRRLLRLLAANTATEVHAAALAADLAIPRTTLSPWIPLLEAVFLVYDLPAWSRNLTRKVVRHAKTHFADSGLAAHLAGGRPEGLLRPGSRAAGPLLETFVAGEVARQASWSEARPELHHFRDRDGMEVDLVLEAPDGRVAALEVKASRSPGARDLRPLAWLRDRIGEDFAQGVLLYTGEEVLPFGDRLTAMPISALWAP